MISAISAKVLLSSSVSRYPASAAGFSSISNVLKKKKKGSESVDDEKTRLDDHQQLLLDKFKARKTARFAQTKDSYRIDVGLIINRPPIFLNLQEYELQRMKLRTHYQKKYGRMMNIPDELLDFNFKDPQMESEETNIDNIATHFIDLGAGDKIEYCESSKYYRKVDPNVTEQRSLQYAPCHRTYLLVKDPMTNKLQFPTRPVQDKEVLGESKLLLWEKMTDLKFQVHHSSVVPTLATRRNFIESEIANPLNRGLAGVKTFYFIASHVQGIPYINPEVYNSYLWTTKRHFQQHVDEQFYSHFINALHDV